MEGSPQNTSVVPDTVNRKRVEYLFELLKKENITMLECLALAAFLLSFVGMLADVPQLRSLAKFIFTIIDDLEEPNGVSHRGNVDNKNEEVPRNSSPVRQESSSVQSEELQKDSSPIKTGL